MYSKFSLAQFKYVYNMLSFQSVRIHFSEHDKSRQFWIVNSSKTIIWSKVNKILQKILFYF